MRLMAAPRAATAAPIFSRDDERDSRAHINQTSFTRLQQLQ
jgi:hypothetical protein